MKYCSVLRQGCITRTWWNFPIREFFLISEWCPCNWKVEELNDSQFAKHNNDGQYTLKLRPVTRKLLIRKCSRWLIIVMNYQRGNSYSFTCRKACPIHKTKKRVLLSYLMEKTLSLNDDESIYICILIFVYACLYLLYTLWRVCLKMYMKVGGYAKFTG